MGKTTIEWTATINPDGTVTPGFTFNPWWGCTKVSPGCTHCYADTLSTRWGHKIWGPKAERRFFGDKHWAEPLKWNAEAEAAGERRRVFCASMADVFERHMLPNVQSQLTLARSRLWCLIEETPYLDWLLLTKRPEHIREMVPVRWLHTPLHNVWYGTSVENQEYADRRIPELLKVPTAVRFLSCEPLLGPVDLSRWLLICELCGAVPGMDIHWRIGYSGWQHKCGHQQAGYFQAVPAAPQEIGISWIIVGGESGTGARPMHPAWARSLRDQCQAAGVAFHFKQWGEYEPYEEDAQPPFWQDQHGHLHDGHGLDVLDPETGDVGKGWHEDSIYGDVIYRRVGKKAAGRLLDGRTWDEFPTVEVVA